MDFGDSPQGFEPRGELLLTIKTVRYKSLLMFFVILTALFAGGCQKKAVIPKLIEPAEKELVEEIFKDMPEEEANGLMNKVREYAEAFDIGTKDKELKALIKAAVLPGTKLSEAETASRQAIAPFMEEQLRSQIVAGLEEIVGRHTEDDVDQVYASMNTEGLIDFVVQYEMERLKMEGYLR